MTGQRSDPSRRVLRSSAAGAAAILTPLVAHAFGRGAGQDKSAELFVVVLSFPVITLASSAGAVVLGRRASRSRAVLQAFGGAVLGLVITSMLGVVLMANSMRDAGFVATSVLTLGAIPAGLIGLIVGGLVSMMERRPQNSSRE